MKNLPSLKILSKFLILFLINSIIVNCIYRKDAFHIFDKFSVLQNLEIYKNQLEEGQCNSTQGTFCFPLNIESYFEETQLIDEIITKIIQEKNNHNKENSLSNQINEPIELDSIINKIQILKDNYLKANQKNINQGAFNINPKIQLNLLLNFESYDMTTQYEDLYMPIEKLISFNVGHLKLNFLGGKLRITQERENGKPKPLHKKNSPYGAHGIVEEEGNNFIYNH